MNKNVHFIKLGGSLITDKNRPITPRPLVIQRLAAEIATTWRSRPHVQFLLSHGSGSYGHVVGSRYSTRTGVDDPQAWYGYAETGYIAAQLNQLVRASLLRVGLPVMSFAPSALVTCADGAIQQLHSQPLRQALESGLIPLVFGDVAFDSRRGGTIVSTEQVLSALVPELQPQHLTLVGKVNGVYDADPLKQADARRFSRLTREQVQQLGFALGKSHGVDVTGGMAAKVQLMIDLLEVNPELSIHLLTGEIPGHVQSHLQDPALPMGTTMVA